MKKKFILLLFMVLASISFGQDSTLSDLYKIGDKSSANPKGLIFDTGLGLSNKTLSFDSSSSSLSFDGNNFNIGDGSDVEKSLNWTGTQSSIKYEPTKGKMQFCDDGKCSYFGTGSGGDEGLTSVIKNNSFENGLNGWSHSGGSLSLHDYDFGTDSNSKYVRFIATSAGQYVESDCAQLPSFIKGGGMSTISATVAASNLFELNVFDCEESTDVSISTSSVISSSEWIDYQPVTTFDLPRKVKVRITSMGPASIDFDKVYTGKDKRRSNTSLRTTTELVFNGTVSGTNPPVTTNSDKVSTITRNIAGDYNLNYKAGAYIRAPSVTGSCSGKEYLNVVSSTAETTNLRCVSSSGTISDSSLINVFISSQDIPSGLDAEALIPDEADFYISANIGGAIVSTLSTSTPLPASHPDLNMTINPGSSQAEIPCSGNNPSTGLTCSTGSESVGIAWNVRTRAKFKLCFSLQGSGSGNSYWRLAETPNNSEVIIQQGRAIAGGGGKEQSIRLCDTFSFHSTGKKTIRMFYEGSGPDSLTIDRNPNLYERDLHITVELISKNSSRSILDNMVTTDSKRGLRVLPCYILNNGTASFDTNDPACSFVNSVQRQPTTGLVSVDTSLSKDGIEKCFTQATNIDSIYRRADGASPYDNWASGNASFQARDHNGQHSDSSFSLNCFPNR